jgi:hypothetical protein
LNNVHGTTQVALNVFGGIDQSLAPSDLPQGLSADNLNCAFQPGSVFTRPPLVRASMLPGTAQIIYSYSFTQANGTQVLLQFTADGKMWANGAQIGQTAPGNRFKCATIFNKAFIATSDGEHGVDVPLQFDGTNLDRVSQNGPGAPPTFTAANILNDQYPINSISQPMQQSWNYASFLQSSGSGSITPGSVVTIYYSDSTAGAAYDADLVTAFTSGYPVYVYLNFTAGSANFGPYVALVTNAPTAAATVPNSGSSHQFFYFTFTVSTTNYLLYSGAGHPAFNVTYQRTMGTLTAQAPIPGLIVGNNVSINGASVPAWNSSWAIAQTPNSGSVNITQTQVTGGIATYSYTVAQGSIPAAGQQVTITGTLNDGGTLNVTNKTIAAASGGTSGTFTISGFTGGDFPSSSESGSGITAGTQFRIDPGALVVNTATNPIYGYSSGGYLVYAGTAQATVAPGQRQGVVFFITRSGYTTVPSPIASFTVPANTNAISVTNLPIGPPNVVARAVAFTGANGGNFFYLAVAPQVNGVVSGTATVINDNSTTSVTFRFSDASLLNGQAIDIPGNNLFRQVVLSSALGMFPYAGRMFAWGEWNVVQDFLNMGFEGGVLAGAPNVPLGWKVTGSGVLIPGVYGLGWQFGVGNTLSQPAYQTQAGSMILSGNTQYSLRSWVNGSVICTFSSALTGFSITATLNGTGNYGYSSFSGLMPQVIPPDFTMTFSGTGEFDEPYIIYSANPYLQTARASYINNPEAFDSVTGIMGPYNDPHATRSMFLRRDALHLLTYGPNGSLYETQDTASGEPNTWQVNQISALCGALSVWGDTKFEDWQVWASDTGLRIYDGSSVDRMSGELIIWWNTLNTAAWNKFLVANDPIMRRIYIGAATGTSTVLNSSWAMDYRELNSAGAMANSAPLKIGISGKMLTTDLTRKWSPWSIQFNHVAVLNGALTFSGGGSLQAATCYTLNEGDFTGVDADYGIFPSFYMGYYMLTADEAQSMHLNPNRKLYLMAIVNVSGTGQVTLTPYPDGVASIPTRAVAIRFHPAWDLQFPLNVRGDRCSFRVTSVPVNGIGGFQLSGMSIALKDDPYAIVRGWNG